MEKAIFFEEIYPLPGVAEEGGLDRTLAWLAELGLDGFQLCDEDFQTVGEERLLAAMRRAGLAATVIHTTPRLMAADDAAFEAGMTHALRALELSVKEAKAISDARERAEYDRDHVIPAMNALRAAVDAMEPLTASDHWPCPTYDQLLFGVR